MMFNVEITRKKILSIFYEIKIYGVESKYYSIEKEIRD